MKEGMNIQELAAEIARIDQAKRDFIAPSEKLLMDYDDEEKRHVIEIPTNGGNELFGINEVAHSQIATKLAIPKRYYERMRHEAPSLLSNNVNTWFVKAPERRLVRTLDGNARAYLSDRYGIYMDNALALTSAMPILMDYPGMEYKSLQLTDRRLYLQCVLPSLEGEIKPGDPIQAGVVISNSEVGFGRFTVERMLFILACSNGAIRGQSLGKTHLSRQIGENIEAFYQKDTIKAEIETFKLMVRDHVKAAFDDELFKKDLQQIKDISERKIERKLDDTVEEISWKFNLYDSEYHEILSRLIQGGDLSQWGMSQAVTNLANDIENYDRVVELERIGGQIIDMTPDQWRVVSG